MIHLNGPQCLLCLHGFRWHVVYLNSSSLYMQLGLMYVVMNVWALWLVTSKTACYISGLFHKLLKRLITYSSGLKSAEAGHLGQAGLIRFIKCLVWAQTDCTIRIFLFQPFGVWIMYSCTPWKYQAANHFSLSCRLVHGLQRNGWL